MKKLIFILTGVLFFTSITIGETFPSKLLTHDDHQLQILKEFGHSPFYPKADTIIRIARKKLTEPLLTVIDKQTLPPSGDSHDYISLAIYYWPDPANPNGPYLSKDGYVNPEKKDLSRYDAPRLERLIYNVNQLALAYYLTGDESLAARAVQFLNTWFIDPATRMNPNLNYGQIVPGKSKLGRPSGIIETRGLIDLLDDMTLIGDASEFTSRKKSALVKWFREYLSWLTTSDIGIKEGKTTNNHSVWYDAQVAAIALWVGETPLARRVISEVPAKRIAIQIEPDGRMPRELARTKAKSYTAFNLQAFITLARIGDRLGINLWDLKTGDGRSIRQAIDWFLPYLKKGSDWPYQQVAPFSPKEFLRALHLANLHYQLTDYDKWIEEVLNN